MRMPPRLAAALVTTALALLTASPAAAALPDARAGEVVGGERLASRGVLVGSGAPAVPQVAAASWLVADVDTGEVLAAKDPHGRYAPASALKALTALTLLPELPADRRVRAGFDDVAVEGSKVGLVEDVDYPVSELFTALLMVSGNDAASVLASAAGGQERTAELMNDKAASLGALDTHAVNPHGLDAEGQVSSAYDLALIARAGLEDPDFVRYSTMLSSSVSAPGGARFEIRNKNKLLTSYPGTLTGKNGFTTAARASYVGAAERDGRRLVVSLMKAAPRVFDEAATLLDWGFAARGAAPVGTLVAVEPEPTSELPAGEVVDAAAGAGTTVPGSAEGWAPEATAARAAAVGREAPDSGTGLPVTLAGLALAAGALVAIRPRRAPARAGGSRSSRDSRRGPAPRPRPERRAPASRAAAPRQPDRRRAQAPRPATRR